MSIAQTVEKFVEKVPAGQIFGYQSMPNYARSPSAVVKAVNRLVNKNQLERLSKGKFYVPKKGLLGVMKPSDSALIRSTLYKGKNLRGYVTGMALYNQLGLTTQMPSTIVIASNGGTQTKDFGTIRIKTIIARVPVEKKNVKILQYLDVLKDIKKISDSNMNLSLQIMRQKISDLSSSEQKLLINIAKNYYSPQVKALTGLLMTSVTGRTIKALQKTLNPTTVFKLHLDKAKWPQAQAWNIK